MIIRHAEKPTQAIAGVKQKGEKNSHHLTVKGWQRAGALAHFFAPGHAQSSESLIVPPQFLFASAPSHSADDECKSHRPEATIKPLAEKLGLKINMTFNRGQESAVASAAQACKGPVLIAWQHDSIYEIAKVIPGGDIAPQHWPENRFDIVFVFTLRSSQNGYSFDQVPQCLLAGDTPDVF
ncbi:hypothetical protein ESZ00_19925 [Silvibacterium dinghuense]|uniref:Histidine phosphatase family protein n=2 Tax=Silvibacterium dinghuense TaxID=1560006 RepID=A0A4Q1S7N8_9BACT|nr:hypothetical protein ESZ00_19925 [Silvibacterium dinghuense]